MQDFILPQLGLDEKEKAIRDAMPICVALSTQLRLLAPLLDDARRMPPPYRAKMVRENILAEFEATLGGVNALHDAIKLMIEEG